MNAERDHTRLLLVDTAERTLDDAHAEAFVAQLTPRDLVVLNDAATIPASISAFTERGQAVELRLVEAPLHATSRVVLFGAGDHRTPTEHRALPPALDVGARVHVAGRVLQVVRVADVSPRLVTMAWPGARAERFALVYRAGAPVQCSYVPQPLALWDVQTRFAARPWAVEMPSAARPLSGAMLAALVQKGVPVATLTHAAGLSATGDGALDQALPLRERYEIPRATALAIGAAELRGGRVLAVGTSVVRALEDCAQRFGRVIPGTRVARLVLDESTRPRVVTGLLTGIHVPGESHYRLLGAFADRVTLARAAEHALARDYRLHEFGDAALYLPGLLSAGRRAA